MGFNDKIQVMDMGKLNTSQGRNLTIVYDRRRFSIGWERWDDGGRSVCNVTSNGTTLGLCFKLFAYVACALQYDAAG